MSMGFAVPSLGPGGVAERSNALVLKTRVRASGPRVRIPPPPLSRDWFQAGVDPLAPAGRHGVDAGAHPGFAGTFRTTLARPGWGCRDRERRAAIDGTVANVASRLGAGARPTPGPT